MHSVGRRRFLVVLAGAIGAGGFWLIRRAPDGEMEVAGPGGSSTSASRAPSTSSNSPVIAESTVPGSAPDPTTTTAQDTTTTSTLQDTTSSTATTETTTEAASPVTAGAVSGSTIEVIPRSAWGAVAAGEFISHVVERITYHHSAVGFLDNRLGPARFRQHQEFHQSLGWPDIAYHLMIDRDGNVYEGRPFDAIGDTGTDYDPTGHFLPLCEGNFDEHDPSDAQLEALAAVIGWARTRFGTDVVGIHRDYASTSCPGDRLVARHDAVVAASERYLGMSLVLLSAEEGAAKVAAIEAG